MGDSGKSWTTFVFTFLLVLILQAVGCFSNHWLYTHRCGNVGLFSNCCVERCSKTFLRNEEPRYLSVPSSIGLQVTSFVVFLCTCIVIVYNIIHEDSGDDCGNSTLNKVCDWCGVCCMLVLYPLAGIASVVGCSLFTKSGLPAESSLGYSFYLCLFAGIYVIFQALCLCCGWSCGKDKESRNPPPHTTTVTTTAASRQLAPVQSNWSFQVAEHEEVQASGNVMFVRRLRITSIAGYFR